MLQCRSGSGIIFRRTETELYAFAAAADRARAFLSVEYEPEVFRCGGTGMSGGGDAARISYITKEVQFL